MGRFRSRLKNSAIASCFKSEFELRKLRSDLENYGNLRSDFSESCEAGFKLTQVHRERDTSDVNERT